MNIDGYCVRATTKQKLIVLQFIDQEHLSIRWIAKTLGIGRSTISRWRKRFRELGEDGFINNPTGSKSNKYGNIELRDVIFALLHSPPKIHGVNRTTWKLGDLKKVMMDEKHILVSRNFLGKLIRSEGYKWRKAKTVLTSTDPEYREKLNKIQTVLSTLGPQDRFFSIDEFGPLSVRSKGGRQLVRAGEYPTIPQYQKSKGCLIITAALELSTNQITHFYSKKKDTAEMIKLMDILLGQYHGCRTLYLSWDAASWNASKRFKERVEEINDSAQQGLVTPCIALAPLPACAQFLNVIESVFSGFARSVIHNSDYDSIEECMAAIDRYFKDRNEHFLKNPHLAGNTIWGNEKTPCHFSDSQNCKDVRYR